MAAMLAATPAFAADVVQAGDPGAIAGSPTPNSLAAAAAFDASTGAPVIVTFESAQPHFTYTNGTPTSAPLGSGSAVWARNTTPGGRYLLELVGSPTTLTFASPISSFGVFLTGVQLNTLSFSFDDGTAQNVAVTNYGSGTQFFGLSNLANPISSITLLNPNDVIGLDDIRFTTATTGAVPEPSTWALMLLGFGAVGWAMRSRTGRKLADTRA